MGYFLLGFSEQFRKLEGGRSEYWILVSACLFLNTWASICLFFFSSFFLFEYLSFLLLLQNPQNTALGNKYERLTLTQKNISTKNDKSKRLIPVQQTEQWFCKKIIELPYNKNKAKAKFWGKTEIGKVYKSWFSQKIYLDKLIRKRYNQKR